MKKGRIVARTSRTVQKFPFTNTTSESTKNEGSYTATSCCGKKIKRKENQ